MRIDEIMPMVESLPHADKFKLIFRNQNTFDSNG